MGFECEIGGYLLQLNSLERYICLGAGMVIPSSCPNFVINNNNQNTYQEGPAHD